MASSPALTRYQCVIDVISSYTVDVEAASEAEARDAGANRYFAGDINNCTLLGEELGEITAYPKREAC